MEIDSEGRYVFVECQLDSCPLLLGIIYAHNVAQQAFLARFLVILMKWEHIPWLLGGDSSSVLDPALDCSQSPLATSPVVATATNVTQWIAHWSLIGSWHALYPNVRGYFYYSPPHDVELDRKLCHPVIHTKVEIGEYLGWNFSDQNPLQFYLNLGTPRLPVPTWRFQSVLLDDSVFRKSTRGVLTWYVSENCGTAPTRPIEWKAIKVVPRPLHKCSGVGAGRNK
ncbi:hypothetical protein NDU88_008834 [Pleurodeles waltl]|uniref:Uncharacterized protein n=1 Tax=Pleurodeles waltl TaxID=8319 RepID=A0AAV7PQA7_PLEWA|nr:hypothetical protein NDU88_008834 [Pleurodeles waltl]